MRAGPLLLVALAGCAQDVVSSAADVAAAVRADARPAEDEDAAIMVAEDATADASTVEDATAGDAIASLDARIRDAAPPDASTALACHVDRFSSCPDPTEVRANNTPSDSTHVALASLGCVSGDNFTPAAAMVSGRVCHTEPADWFDVGFVPCDTITLRAQVQLTIDTPCEPDAFELQVIGRPCDGSNPDVECTAAGNVQTVVFAIRPGWSVGSLDFGVVRQHDAVVADYRLTYQLTR